MANKEDKAEVKEEKSGKSVALRRGTVTPFRSFDERFEQMERFMDRMMGGLSLGHWMRPFERDWAGFSEMRAPAVDLIERENEIVVRAELPGVKKEDISVSLAADSITIETLSKKEEEEEKGDYRRREIRSSAYSRNVGLPSNVNAEAAKAVFNDGVLEVTLPKTPEAKGRTVPVE